MWAEIPADPFTFVKLLTGAGITGLLVAAIWFFAKGTIRFGRESAERDAAHARELAQRDKEIEWRDKQLAERTTDRDKWIASFIQGLDVSQKNTEAVTRLRDSVEELVEAVAGMAGEFRKLADEIRLQRGQGKG